MHLRPLVKECESPVDTIFLQQPAEKGSFLGRSSPTAPCNTAGNEPLERVIRPSASSCRVKFEPGVCICGVPEGKNFCHGTPSLRNVEAFSMSQNSAAQVETVWSNVL